ncbi:hypothetical protein L1267_12130 [Pseudoalteromonas sp. OFAV1]|jgi:hypothetical protein|uniref:hypothetical protein n=1 Tax=Pseudoalteromonas sp. OFAV1 TaxID=2908892 RepID=UPI001F16E0DE|nr:hypothetical protein [Pseudoalteromonas sp. OFAV1]MCF2901139.1 hypothetical protein [Pseudoalteromonas sp. OFAV1]
MTLFKWPKYRIIYTYTKGDPCCWQLQKRVYLLFWKDIYLSFASATTAGNEMLDLIKADKK